MPEKTALIVEGGAMRSVFSAGLLDGFLYHHFNPFDCSIGVSAGASNLLFYHAKMPGESFRIFRKAALGRHFIKYSRFLGGGHLLDMDWLLEDVSFLKDQRLQKTISPGRVFIGITEVLTGKAVYADACSDNLPGLLKASMSLPLLYRDFPVYQGRTMTDGGVADGIPVAEAIRRGAQKIMVIRSQHSSYVKKDTIWHKYIRWKLCLYPNLVKTMRQRMQIFDNTIKLIKSPPAGVTIIDIHTPKEVNIGRFCRNEKKLEAAYQLGLTDSKRAIEKWQNNQASIV